MDSCKIAINYLSLGCFCKVYDADMESSDKFFKEFSCNSLDLDCLDTLFIDRHNFKFNADQLCYYNHYQGVSVDTVELIKSKDFFAALKHGYFYSAMVIAWDYLKSLIYYKTDDFDEVASGGMSFGNRYDVCNTARSHSQTSVGFNNSLNN